MAAKKGAKKAASHAAPASSGSKLKQATWHKGRMYDPENKKDRADFDALLAKDDKLAKVARTAKPKGKKGETETQGSDPSAPIGGGVEGVEAEDVEETEE